MVIVIVLLFGLVMSFAVGIACLIWPGKVQAYALKTSSKYNPFLGWMKTKGYILACHVLGVLAIALSIIILLLIVLRLTMI